MSSIWHTKKKKATEDKTIFAQHKSIIRDSGVDWFIWEPQEFTDATRADVIAWCYLDDLLALETELERTRKALELAIMGLKNCKTRDHIGAVCRTPEYVDKILEQINTITKGGNNE